MLTTTLKNALCDAFKADVTHISLHTDDPGATGANDSGITHASITWGSSSGGTVSGTASFTGITGDFTHVGYWESATFRGSEPNEFSLTVADDVSYTVTAEVGE